MTGPLIAGNNSVVGILVELRHKIYVVCVASNTKQVFESLPPFFILENIAVKGLENVIDVAACPCKSGRQALWCVN